MPSLAVDSPPTAAPGACTPDAGRVPRFILGIIFVVLLPGMAMTVGGVLYNHSVFSGWLPLWTGMNIVTLLPDRWHTPVMAWVVAIYLTSVASWVGWLVAERLRRRGGVVNLLLSGALTSCGSMALLAGVLMLVLIFVVPGIQLLFWLGHPATSSPLDFLFLMIFCYVPILLGLTSMGLAVLVPLGCGFTLWRTALYANSLCGGGVRVGAACGFMLALASVVTLTVAFC